jgi:RNase H-like domain found in reverse transcriptase
LEEELEFLGFRVSKAGLLPRNQSFDGVAAWKLPNMQKKFLSFLGFTNYLQRFRKNYAKKTCGMLGLLKENTRSLNWTPVTEQEF